MHNSFIYRRSIATREIIGLMGKSSTITSQDYQMQSRLIGRLERSGGIDKAALARKLNRCRRKAPYCSGACPLCGRQFQDWFSRQAISVLKDEKIALSRLSFVYPNRNGLDLSKKQRLFQRELRRVGISFAIGGLDISFNEDHREGIATPFESHWCVHLWIVGSALEIANAVASWRKEKRFKPTAATPKPSVVDAFNEVKVVNARYSLKSDFIQRDSIIAPATVRRDSHRNTRHRPLRKDCEITLALALDQAGIASRLILLGVQLRTDGPSPKLRRRVRKAPE